MILRDFYCATCDVTFEEYVSKDDRTAKCQKCGNDAESVLSAPRIGVYHDPKARSAALRKRSHDHTIREMKKEPERYGFEADDKRRWNLRTPSKSST